MNIRVKSVYAGREPTDGYKVLVDDFLPASMNERMAGVDLWMRSMSPGKEVRDLFEQGPDKWEEFKAAFFRDLEEKKGHLVEIIMDLAASDGVTLFFSTADPERNVATAIQEYIETREEKLRKAA